MDQLAAGRTLLPAEGYEEYCLEGGNHARFGSYGEQVGDGTATISREAQISLAVEHIAEFISA